MSLCASLPSIFSSVSDSGRVEIEVGFKKYKEHLVVHFTFEMLNDKLTRDNCFGIVFRKGTCF